jgi:SAM-dependent methyltransferase
VDKKGMNDGKRNFSERRSAGRLHADELRATLAGETKDLDFFDALYQAANGDPAAVPWAGLEPHPGLAEWIGRSGHLYEGSALDVGCGLGDNAEALSHLGYNVTGFDLSQTAINWAIERFPDSAVRYVQADLFQAPKDWHRAFAFVHETYTLQALPNQLRTKAMQAIAEFVAPGGILLVICRSRPGKAETGDGPPWPLTRGELETFKTAGLVEKNFQEFVVRDDREIPHFRIEFERQK